MKIRIPAIPLIAVLFLLTAWISVGAQSSAFVLKPYGSAVIVSDIEKSVKWYQSVFGLRIKTTINDPDNAYKIVILESDDMMLEVLQLRGSVSRQEILKGQPEGSQLQGHFKIGFIVSDLDSLLRHLAQLKVEVPRVWTDSQSGKRNFLITDPDGNYIQFFD